MNLSYRTNESENTILAFVHSSSTLAVGGSILYIGVLQGAVWFSIYLVIGVSLIQCVLHIALVYPM